MKKLVKILLIVLTITFSTKAQILEWAKQIGGTSNDYSSSIAVDSQGNLFTIGFFQGTVDFDPGTGIYNLTATGDNDVFISKLDPSGNFIWARRIGGMGDDRGFSIALDGSGNIYTTGWFSGTADFNPGAGNFNMTSVGSHDVFILKLDASGNFIWAKRLGGTNGDYGFSIAVDGNENVYTTGHFWGTADFDPGVDVFSLTSVAFEDIFISKLDASGNFVWAKRMGGTSGEQASSIAVDISGNVYTTGWFSETADFDPGVDVFSLTSDGFLDIFISKLDASGNFVWAKQLGGTNTEEGKSLVLDASGNVYTTGFFEGTIDFDPGAGIYNLTADGGSDIFISKLDASGNFVWAKRMGGTSAEQASSIAVDISGNIYTTGSFAGTVDFDPGTGIFNLTSTGYDDIFISKLDASGNFIWAKHMGGIESVGFGNSIAVDNFNNVYITGIFDGIVNFNPNVGVYNLTSAGYDDIFISKTIQSGIVGWVYNDVNENCIRDEEAGIEGRKLIINPGNILVSTNSNGLWHLDSLPIGTYTITADTSGKWSRTCSVTQTFTVNYSDSLYFAPIFGFKAQFSLPKIFMFHDFNQNCINENTENGIVKKYGILMPGNIVVETNNNGFWSSTDTLNVGIYTLIVDSLGKWESSCSNSISFHTSPFGIDTLYSFGFVSTEPCAEPDVSINMPSMRPGFSNQKIYVKACNQYKATGALNNAYVIVELDPQITPQSGSQSYTSLGNNQYRFNLGNLNPGVCKDFWLACSLSVNATLGETLCMKANLFPADSCVFDTIPDVPTGVTPCTLPWDKSSLKVEGSCVNDSIRFVIYNTGQAGGGNMQCFAPVRIYVDGVLISLDSIMLAGGDSIVFMFAGDGRTWRLEADQHPLHPGRSRPNATVENCNPGTWTPGLVNNLPQDDADPIVDIYCGVVTGSYDPNDKQGFPLGITTSST
jgi:hypothetical protein